MHDSTTSFLKLVPNSSQDYLGVVEKAFDINKTQCPSIISSITDDYFIVFITHIRWRKVPENPITFARGIAEPFVDERVTDPKFLPDGLSG